MRTRRLLLHSRGIVCKARRIRMVNSGDNVAEIVEERTRMA